MYKVIIYPGIKMSHNFSVITMIDWTFFLLNCTVQEDIARVEKSQQ